MIRFRLKELLAEKGFQEGRIITLKEIAEATGVNRMTLSKIANNRNANPTIEVLDKLCTYFNCSVCDLAEHIPDKHEGGPEDNTQT